MEKAKYVIVEGPLAETIIVFPALFKHSDFAPMGKIVSAGFIRINEEFNYVCYGKSVSLGIGSREKDSQIAEMQLGVMLD